MSTKVGQTQLESALSGIPKKFRSRLVERYGGLKAAFTSGQYDACGLRAAKFCEIMLRLLQDRLTGSYIAFGSKIPNFEVECGKLQQTLKSAGPESLRILLPKALAFLYSIRNKRGIGHEAGDVDANRIDAVTCARLADWCLCELMRVVHKLSLEQAQELLDAISGRQLPVVWSVLDRKRVLKPAMDYSSKTLVLLYSEPGFAVPAEDLFRWTEHSNMSVYRRDVLRRLHDKRLIEYDRETEMAVISPLGIQRVEEKILPAF